MFRLGVKTASNESNENAERLIQGRSNAFVVRNKRRVSHFSFFKLKLLLWPDIS